MKKVVKTLVVLFFILFVAVGCDNKNNVQKDDEGNLPDGEVTDDPDVKDKDENGEFITAGANNGNDKGEGDYGDSGNTGNSGAPEDDENASGDDAEREIVESDIYKVDGNTIWVVNRYKGLIAIDMKDPKALKVVGKAPFEGIPGEMYLSEGRAYILVTGLNGKDLDDKEGYWGGRSMSKVIVVNTEQPSAPKVIGSYELDGTIVDSRQVGDVIYVAATQYKYYWYWCDSRDEYGKDQITLISINISDPADIKKVDEVSLEGTAYTIYVSQKSIYVAEANYDYWNNDYNQKYPVTLFDISDPDGKIVKKGEFETDGFMSDRWKMYEKGDVFFAVSTSDQWGGGDSMIESFDISDPENIEQINKLTFMTGQQLYGTKFEGDRMYAVTYFQQDPLHVIDISDPANLIELGQLEVPGWSTHLEIRGDKILSVGIDDTDGWKTKVSMYDVSDPENPKEMSMIAIGSNYSWSEATQDWKAFKIYDDLGLILLPVNEYEENTWRYMYKLYLLDFDLEKGLKQRGSVTSDSPVMRGVALENEKIISIGDRHVMMIDAADRDKPEILSTAVMAYYVENINTCGNKLCGIDSSYYSQPSTLVTYEPGNDTNPVNWRSNPVSKEAYSYANLIKSGDMGYVFNNMYWYYYGPEDGGEIAFADASAEDETETDAKYVKIFKFDDAKNPEEIGSVKILPLEDESEKYYYSYNNAAVSTTGALAFTNQDYDYFYPESDCYESETDCVVKGEGYSIYRSSMYVYDISDPSVKEAKPVVISNDGRALDYDTKIIANGSTFWYTDCERKGVDEKDRELLYCYAVPVDVKDPAKPVKGKKVNIPGKIIGMSDDGKYLYTYHYMWNDEVSQDDENYYNSTYFQTLYILKFNDDKTKVSVIKKISVTNEYESTESMYRYRWSDFIVKNDKVFIGTNETLYNYEQQECNYWYYSNRETSMNVQIFRAEDGKRLFNKSYENGARYSSVEGGGFLLSIEENEDYYYGYTNSNNMIYLSADGVEKELKLAEKTYGYYSYSLSAAVIGDDLFVARDWNGIEQVSLK
ncbi:MAG TPA: beta-propeller domain-containing protein [bacterium]|nr:beta-propeller domain-containing protein [bacterium]